MNVLKVVVALLAAALLAGILTVSWTTDPRLPVSPMTWRA